MRHQREARLKETLFHLIELFQDESLRLSSETLEGIVLTLEGLRWDADKLHPGREVGKALEGRLRDLSPDARRRFEAFVRELLLRQTA